MPVQSLAERFGVSLSEGTTVFRQGEPGGSVYVIRAGKVRVLKESNGRRRMVTTLGPGDFFGEMAVVTGRPRTATVEVVEDADLLKVPADKLQEMVAGTGEVVMLPGEGHVLAGSDATIRERLEEWLPPVLRLGSDP